MRVRYTTTVDHLMALHRHHHAKSALRKLRKYVVLAVILLVFTALYRISRPGRELEYLGFGATFSMIFLAVIWVETKVGEWYVKRSYGEHGRNRSVLCEHVLEVTPEALVERTPFGETHSKWNSIEAVEESKGYLFIYIQAHAAHVVPKSSLAEGDAQEFREALLARVASARAA